VRFSSVGLRTIRAPSLRSAGPPASLPGPAAPRTRLNGRLLLLLPEVAALPFVHFSPGPRTQVARARVCSAPLLALAAFLLLPARRAGPPAGTPWAGAFWLAAHLGLVAAFFRTTTPPAGAGQSLSPWPAVPSCLVPAGAVGGMVFLGVSAALPAGSWRGWGSPHPGARAPG